MRPDWAGNQRRIHSPTGSRCRAVAYSERLSLCRLFKVRSEPRPSGAPKGKQSFANHCRCDATICCMPLTRVYTDPVSSMSPGYGFSPPSRGLFLCPLGMSRFARRSDKGGRSSSTTLDRHVLRSVRKNATGRQNRASLRSAGRSVSGPSTSAWSPAHGTATVSLRPVWCELAARTRPSAAFSSRMDLPVSGIQHPCPRFRGPSTNPLSGGHRRGRIGNAGNAPGAVSERFT